MGDFIHRMGIFLAILMFAYVFLNANAQPTSILSSSLWSASLLAGIVYGIFAGLAWVFGAFSHR